MSDFREGRLGLYRRWRRNWTFPGVLQNGLFRSDPVTHFNEIGKFFYLSLRSDGFIIFLRRRLGFNERRPILGTIVSPRRRIGGDKEWFTIDKNVGGMGHGFQYQIWTDFFACDVRRIQQIHRWRGYLADPD